MEDTRRLVSALVQGGAAVVELGVPFSDPLADGATIQNASMVALENRVNLGTCLEVAAALRSDGVTVPLVFMGYYNPILSYGLERFAIDAQDAGLDGLIVPDLPFEEADALQNTCRQHDIHFIPLLAPTSTDERIARSCEKAAGFVYCVSLTGVTGAREELPPGISTFIQRVRKHTDLPLAIGFGISQRHHVETLAPWAQAAVVGSALIEVVEKTPDGQREKAVKDFVAGLRGMVPTTGRQ